MPYDYDRSYPQGLGLTILHQLTHGLAPTELLHSESSNSGLTNPTLTNWVFALVGLFDPSPYTATLITAFVGAIVAAITYNLGKKLFGRTVGLIALAIVASSPWSAFFARGSWYTGFFELSAVVPAWLLIKALLPKTTSPKAIVVAVLSSAVLAHFYLVSFALIAQMASVLFLARAQLHAKAKLLVVFIAAWLISFALMAVVIAYNRSSNIRPEGFELVYGNPSQDEKEKAAVGINLVTLPRFGSLVSGRWEGWLEHIHTTTQEILRGGNQIALTEGWLLAYRTRATAIEAALIAGFALWLVWARARRIVRVALAWLLVPVLGQIFVTSLLPTFPANHQNLFLASPLSYIMAACGFAAVVRWSRKLLGALGALRAINLVGALGLVALVGIPIIGWMADAQALLRPTPIPPADAMPLLWQLRLGEVVRQNCTKLNAPENPFELTRLKMQYWAAGLMQDAGRVRPSADIHVGNADAWQVSAQGGDCAIRTGDQTGPPFAQPIEITVPELTGRVKLYKALPVAKRTNIAIQTNIGWRLVAIDYPASTQRGQTIVVNLSWQIERLPGEPFAAWRYDPFINLIGPSGQSLAQADTPSVAGGAWVVGEYIQTATRLQLPGDLPPGEYKLAVSLFDRAQSKNAAFFREGFEPSASFELALRVK